MRRDFTEEYKQKLLGMIRENEAAKWCDFTDWMGDRLLDFADWIGVLDLYGSIQGADAYTKAILDKNNTSAGMIEQIFKEVHNEDEQCAGRVKRNICSGIKAYKNLLVDMQSVISPGGEGFQEEQIGKLISAADILRSAWVKIQYDAEFSRDVYELIYDKNGKRKKVADISDEDKDKVIKAFEDTHSEWADELDKILKSGNPNTLTEDDIRNIKFIAYTADEPYRSIYLENVKKYTIGAIGDPENGGAFYSPSRDAVYFEDNTNYFSEDPRGAYTTFFHESGHATDYNQNDSKDPYTLDFTVYSEEMGREVTLMEAIEYDVYSDIESQIQKYSGDEETVKRILDAFRYGNDTSGLSKQEKAIYDRVVNYYNSDLSGEVNEAACDVYGGMTNLKIGQNGYGHRPADGDINNFHYWYDKNGNATGSQAKELWAEYFSYCMTGDEEALDSLREHFPAACKVLDAIAEKMGEKVK